MWVKIDDGFATHPKILSAGPLAALIQIRAICFASQNKTDGFLPASAINILLHGLEELGIDTGSIGDYASVGCQANELDWPSIMVHHQLWEVRDGGYYVHDYLEWNLSKKEQESFRKKKSYAGKKGMKSRWNKEKSQITDVITSSITDVITKRYHATSTSSSSSSSLKSDSEFEQFWNVYPKKIGKRAALQAWRKAKDKPPLVDIMQVIDKAKQSEQWTKENGQFIPHPSTWLNQGRWMDEPIVKLVPKPFTGHTKVCL